ncbi:MAG TPA: hypothetical protein DCM67_04475 [Propionibacteriaceae bacterium]|nr:hypothetical protein [Propionibacteriaceae bacterium]
MPITADSIAEQVPGLMRYALALTRDSDAATELVQDTVVRGLERADQFRGDSGPATWLHRIMYRRFLDDQRRRRPLPVDDAEELAAANERDWADDAYSVSADVVVERAEDRDALRDALIRVPANYRAAVLLHDVEGLTVPEVAEIQEVSLAAAKQRLRRGRQMLVSALASGVERRADLAGVPLNCWTVRSRIGDYLDDELDSRERALLEKHLAGCPTCPALYASMVGVTGALAAMRRDPESVIPEQLANRVRSVLAHRE